MAKELSIKDLEKKASELRIAALKAISKAGSGHTGSSMSLMDALVTLDYAGGAEEEDYVILSKGHGAPAQYAILADKGFFDKSELDHLRQAGALLQGHPVVKIPGIAVSTGSLGQGFSVAHGIALSLKLDKENQKVFVVLGDGELQEGIVWETAMSAAHYMSNNLIAIVDNNGLQIDGSCKKVMNVQPIRDKFVAFGWRVIEVVDGHDFEELIDAVRRARAEERKPVCIWCHTVKGKGVPFAENKVEYHGVALSEEEMKVAEAELKCN